MVDHKRSKFISADAFRLNSQNVQIGAQSKVTCSRVGVQHSTTITAVQTLQAHCRQQQRQPYPSSDMHQAPPSTHLFTQRKGARDLT